VVRRLPPSPAAAAVNAYQALIPPESPKGRGLHWMRIRDGPRAGSGVVGVAASDLGVRVAWNLGAAT